VVAPRLRQTWMVHARFTHAPHGAVACETCHDAGGSEDSDTLLLPQIETCRTCHGTVDSFDTFETRCADCHQYHQGSVLHHGKFTGMLADEPGEEG
jgi:predicted CXXCH cytochrome family protein